MDLTNWFCWVTVVGAVMGLLAAVQQFLNHGLGSFVRAVFVTFVIGLALALGYPHVQMRTTGGGTPIALAVNATPVEPTPDNAAPIKRTPLSPTTTSPASTPVECGSPGSTSAEPTPLKPVTADSTFKLAEPVPVETTPVQPPPLIPISLGPTTTDPASTPVECELPESTLAEPTPLNPVTAHSTFKLADPAPINRTPIEPGTVPKERAKTADVKPTLPALLPAQQKLFSPSEVVYCPICSSAYSSKGPKVGVTCPHCGGKANLGSSHDYMVHRCGTCGKLCRTTHFPPVIGPYFFRYYCPYCKEYHWFRD